MRKGSNAGKEQDQAGLDEWVQVGSEMAASVAGVAVGFAVGGPAGAIAGAAGTPPLVRVVRDFADRLLSPGQRRRASEVVLLVGERIRARQNAGDELRDDGFFTVGPKGRPPAEELAEAVLLAAQGEHEERKLPFLANLFANIAFDKRVDRATGNQLVRLAERLSYRQVCLLALFVNRTVFALPTKSYRDAGITNDNLFAGVLVDALELYGLGFLGDGNAWLSLLDVNPGASVQGLGQWLYELMGLQGVEITDMAILAMSFQSAALPEVFNPDGSKA